jgi:hypothetical protein
MADSYHGGRWAREPSGGLAAGPDLYYSRRAVPTLRTLASTALLSLGVALAGCDEPASAASPDAAPPPPSSSAKPPAPSASASAASPSGELRVLKMSFTTEVKNKEPVDAPKVAEAGQRIWAHLTMRNRTGAERGITLAFLVGGVERSKTELTIASSWSYRTWGYVTLRPGDVGEVVAEVRDEGGTVMERQSLPIKKSQK